MKTEPVPPVKKQPNVKKEPEQKPKLEPGLKKQPEIPKALFTYDFTAKMTCTRHLAGSTSTVDLRAGPAFLLVAEFADPDELHTTEFSNLMLAARPEAKPAKVKEVLKKPASSGKKKKKPSGPAAPAPEEPPAPALEFADKDYGIMYYKKDKTCAIRAKFGSKGQLFGFGAGSGASEAKLREIAKELVKDLKSGITKDVCKEKGNRLAVE